MHWAEGEQDRTFMQRSFRLCISVADGLNAGLQAQRWHTAWQQKVRTHCVPKVAARENLPERTYQPRAESGWGCGCDEQIVAKLCAEPSD